MSKRMFAGFKIAMNDAFGVRQVEGGREAIHNAHDFVERERAVFEPLGECAARHQTHDEVRLFVFFAKIVDGEDGGVFEQGDGFGFAFKARAERGVFLKIRAA